MWPMGLLLLLVWQGTCVASSNLMCLFVCLGQGYFDLGGGGVFCGGGGFGKNYFCYVMQLINDSLNRINRNTHHLLLFHHLNYLLVILVLKKFPCAWWVSVISCSWESKQISVNLLAMLIELTMFMLCYLDIHVSDERLIYRMYTIFYEKSFFTHTLM